MFTNFIQGSFNPLWDENGVLNMDIVKVRITLCINIASSPDPFPVFDVLVLVAVYFLLAT